MRKSGASRDTLRGTSNLIHTVQSLFWDRPFGGAEVVEPKPVGGQPRSDRLIALATAFDIPTMSIFTTSNEVR